MAAVGGARQEAAQRRRPAQVAVLHVEFRAEEGREHGVEFFALHGDHMLAREVLREDLVDIGADLFVLAGRQQL